MTPLLSLADIRLRYGAAPLLDGIEFQIERGDRICLLGANGAGKSSLLRIIAGESEPDSGQVIRSPGLRLARLPQQVPSHLAGRVMDIVCPGAGSGLEARNHQAKEIVSRLNLDPDADFSALSGGIRRRVLLARALFGAPDIVLLDEPTNHLDLDSIAWLESFLLRCCCTFMFVTHDRSFLRRLASRVVELDRGRLSDFRCDYDTFLRRKDECLQAETRQRARFDKRLEQEEAWIRRGVKARAIRNQGRVRALEALREQRAQRRERTGAVQMAIEESGRTGQVVLKTRDLNFGFGGRALIRECSLEISRGDKIGILGPNGCGKTTLLRLLLQPAGVGGLAPASGSVTHGTSLRIAYYDQLHARLDDALSLADNIAQGREFVVIRGVRRHVFGYLEDFLFEPDRARQPAGLLSGGERSRLLLARLFAQPSNVLVLDEPTNDLDLDTLELLEEQMIAYSGTVLLVSHDRDFLNNVASSVLVFEKHHRERPGSWLRDDEGWYVNEYVGGHDDWARCRLVPPPPGPPAPRPAQKRERPAALRLGEKDRRELEALPGRIEALEAEQAMLHAGMAEPVFYRQRPDMIAGAKDRAARLAVEIEQAYARWEQLEGRKTA